MRLISDGDHRAVRSDSEARRDRHPQDSMIQTDTFLWRPRSASVSLSLTFSNRSVSLSPSLSVRPVCVAVGPSVWVDLRRCDSAVVALRHAG